MNPAQFTAARTALGLSKTDMAKAIGKGVRIVSYYETGERPVSVTVARLVAHLIAQRRVELSNMEVC